ncbi:SMAD/FHA domain-containing protein [Lactarius quietus]|nr:SMAD/FHA domain-containing protein [Lactarius quietus]
MPRSPSPSSSRRHGDREDVDRYRSRRGAPDNYGRGAARDSYRDRDGKVSERDRRRDYRDDDDYRRRDDDDRRRRRDEYDDGRRRRDDGRRTDDDYRSRREDFRDREDRPPRGRRERDGEHGGSARRSASPQRSRPPSHPHSRSHSASAPPAEDKAKPNFAPSGLLAAATNTVKNSDGTSTLLKYNEPPEARKPLVGWRLYVFKGEEQLELLHIHRQSAYLVGRDRMVADIPLEHPSCSKQHAVIQYRLVPQKDELGVSKPMIKPFVIDLESTNGTHVNGEAIPTSRYYELKASDVLKFGTSNREYVLLHDEVS